MNENTQTHSCKVSKAKKTVLMCVAWAMTSAAVAGNRPYEFEWANRTQDDHPALFPLTSADGWRVESTKVESVAFITTAERGLFGDSVTRLVISNAVNGAAVKLIPPAPAKVPAPFEAMSLWAFGDWKYDTPPGYSHVTVAADFVAADGAALSVPFEEINFPGWGMIRQNLTPAQREKLSTGATFVSFTVTGAKRVKNSSGNLPAAVTDLSSFCCFEDEKTALAFKPRPKRPNRVFPEAPQGLNTGDGYLPFPTTPLTVIPDETVKGEVTVEKGADGSWQFIRTGTDGTLRVRLPKKLGIWDEAAFKWNASPWYPFATTGGVWFVTKNPLASERGEDVSFVSEAKGNHVLYSGDVKSAEGRLARVTIDFHLEGKALAADVKALGGEVASLRFGEVQGVAERRDIVIPYYMNRYFPVNVNRPAVCACRVDGKPFFINAFFDWYTSNGSWPFCVGNHLVEGVNYRPKTDGARNDCYERFVWVFSPEFGDIFPRLANPVAKYKEIAGSNLWRAWGANQKDAREKHIVYWGRRKRRGMTKIIVTDHEMMWRDENESFTFRTRTAPGKGGDESQKAYTRTLIDDLGLYYGPYNNYTDLAPINGHWHPDHVTRDENNQFRRAWVRCFAPKPAWINEAAEKILPELQRKFGFNCAYDDVITIASPWERADYDARVPGAATFAATFYAFGENLLLQKNTWKGPVYSEGGAHFLYSGLSDGNYARDFYFQQESNNWWVVDFDLLRIHPLECNFGMGTPRDFYPRSMRPNLPADRFLAATLAFGHPGYFIWYPEHEEYRSYFMVQAIAARYTRAEAREIRYGDGKGAWLAPSEAMLSGAFMNNQIRVSYSDGTRVVSNGSLTEPLVADWCGRAVTLPPSGYVAETAAGEVRVFSGNVDGQRCDLSVAPEYVYIDGRGTWAEFAEGASDGIFYRLVVKDSEEVFLADKATKAALPYAAKSVTPLDEAGKPVPVGTPLVVEKGRTLLKPQHGVVSWRVVK